MQYYKQRRASSYKYLFGYACVYETAFLSGNEFITNMHVSK